MAAADRPNSSTSRMHQRRRRGSGGGQLRASEPPIVRLMTPCLGGCALYASTRGMHTHKVHESLNTRTQQKQEQHKFAAAADRPNSSSSSSTQQRRRRRGSGGDQLRASEPPIVRLMTQCLVAARCLGLSRVLYFCRLCCVTCALLCVDCFLL